MRKSIYSFLSILLIFLAACSNTKPVSQPMPEPPETTETAGEETKEGESEDKKVTDPEDPMAWVGTYEGILPCEDCEGIRTSLHLTVTEDYILRQEYIGKEAEPVVYDWVFIRTMNWDFILLLNQEGEIIADIEIGDGVLYVLDDQRERHAGADAEQYILRKVE